MKFYIKTYGCQMNERDSESVAALLTRRGFEPAGDESEAELVLVNTCSVREKAEQKALGKLGLLVAASRDRPGRVVGVMGCMAQRLGERVFEKVKGLDFAVGTHRLAQLPTIVDMVAEGQGPVLDVAEDCEEPEHDLLGHRDGDVSAFVNIMFGCDRRCSYCVVPDVRGREWSRPAANILREVRGLVRGGCREVTLLGQSVMSYGRKTPVWEREAVSPRGYREPLAHLLEAVNDVAGLRRVRFTSGHPSGCSSELAEAIGALPSVAHHLHMPLQSGSDRLLRMMRRGYTTEGYREAVSTLRRAVPGIALTTDIIVGYPTESDGDFESTREFMDEMGFDNAFVFKYSPRSGTAAASLTDDVPPEEKLRRNKVLLADQDRRSLAINGRSVGRHVEVLVQGPSPRNASRWCGRTTTNKIVIFDPEEGMQPGDLTWVRIDRVRAQTLYGRAVTDDGARRQGAACREPCARKAGAGL